MHIKFEDAKICIECRAVYDRKHDQAYGRNVCVACGAKQGVSIELYITAESKGKEESYGN